ncbi:hypothetical protein GOBAR_DD36476 [Gossypium barbadense]|nr:hypothetical protein GOBAR_DD36476 [Gossypium barbadense]
MKVEVDVNVVSLEVTRVKKDGGEGWFIGGDRGGGDGSFIGGEKGGGEGWLIGGGKGGSEGWFIGGEKGGGNGWFIGGDRGGGKGWLIGGGGGALKGGSETGGGVFRRGGGGGLLITKQVLLILKGLSRQMPFKQMSWVMQSSRLLHCLKQPKRALVGNEEDVIVNANKTIKELNTNALGIEK